LPQAEPEFAVVLWQERALDVWVQIALIFAGVIGVLGLLADVFRVGEAAVKAKPESPQPQPVIKEVEDALAH
jgi:hypothetical protein